MSSKIISTPPRVRPIPLPTLNSSFFPRSVSTSLFQIGTQASQLYIEAICLTQPVASSRFQIVVDSETTVSGPGRSSCPFLCLSFCRLSPPFYQWKEHTLPLSHSYVHSGASNCISSEPDSCTARSYGLFTPENNSSQLKTSPKLVTRYFRVFYLVFHYMNGC